MRSTRIEVVEEKVWKLDEIGLINAGWYPGEIYEFSETVVHNNLEKYKFIQVGDVCKKHVSIPKEEYETQIKENSIRVI